MFAKEERVQSKSDATLLKRRTTFAHTLELLTSVLLYWPHRPNVESPSLLLAGPSGNGKSYLVYEAFSKAHHIMSTTETTELHSHMALIKPSLAEIITVRKMDGSTALRSELRESISKCCKEVNSASTHREFYFTKSSNCSMENDSSLCGAKTEQFDKKQDNQSVNNMSHLTTNATITTTSTSRKAECKSTTATNKDNKEITALVILDHLEYFLLHHNNDDNTEDISNWSDQSNHSFRHSHHAGNEHGTNSHNANGNPSTVDHTQHSTDHSAHVAHPELITDLYHVLQPNSDITTTTTTTTTTAPLFSTEEVQHLHLRRIVFVGLFSAELNSLLSFARFRLFRLCITLSTPTEEERHVFFASQRRLSRCHELVNALASRSGGMTYGALVEIVNIVQSLYNDELTSLMRYKRINLEEECSNLKQHNEVCKHTSTQCLNECSSSNDSDKEVESSCKVAECSFRAQVNELAQSAVKTFQTSSSSNAAYYRESAGYVDVQETRWDDIAGMEQVKKMLQELITAPLHRKKLYDTFHVRPSTGVLLHGPPGTGKTMLARAMATELNASFIYLDLPELLQCEVGESEQKLSDFFNLARERSPTVMFIDEIQAAFGIRFAEYYNKSNNLKRSDYNHSNNNHVNSVNINARAMSSSHDARLVSHFLHLLDVAHEDSAHTILFVGATNVIAMLDPQLLRAGRLDTIVEVALPDRAARRALIRQIVFGDWSRWFAPQSAKAELEEIKNKVNKTRKDGKSNSVVNEMSHLHMSINEQNALHNTPESEKPEVTVNDVHVADVQNLLINKFVDLSDGLSGAALRNAANTFALRFVQFVVDNNEFSTNVNTDTNLLVASKMNMSKYHNEDDIDSNIDKTLLCDASSSLSSTMLMRSLVCANKITSYSDNNNGNGNCKHITLTTNVIALLEQAVNEQKRILNQEYDKRTQI